MPGRAGRREGAGDREQRDPLAAEELAAGGRLGAVGGGDGQRNVGQAVADLDGHQMLSFASGEAADRLAVWRASSLARRAAAAHCRGRWLISRRFLSGKFLLAMPGMADPRFERAVIAMCVHDENGAIGIGIGHKRAGISFRGLLRQLEIEPGEAPDCAVHHGGPVEPGRGFVLHSTDWGGQDTLHVNGDKGELFAMTGTIDVLRAIAEGQRAVAVDRGARLCRLGRGPARRGDDPARLVRRAAASRRSCSTRRPTSAGRRAFKAAGHRPAAAGERDRRRLNSTYKDILYICLWSASRLVASATRARCGALHHSIGESRRGDAG